MSLPRVEISVELGADTPDHSRTDYPFNRSRRDSLASSRFSSRLSRRSSVRDEVQSLDEFLRKQRVIRYMQEERERAERSKLLREEHDFWVEFRDRERAERLKYMTEQEIVELLQREADEATRESNRADQFHQRAMEDALRRRHITADVQRGEEDSALARLKGEVQVDGIRLAAERETSVMVEAMTVAERTRRPCIERQQREEDLTAKCQQLTTELEEARASATRAQRYQKRAEDDLTRERENTRKEKTTAAACKEANDKLLKELAEVRQQLTASEAERKKAEAAKAQAAREVAQKEEELTSLRKRNDELSAQQTSQKAAAEDEKQRAFPFQEELKAYRDALDKEQAARSRAETEVAALRAQAKALEARVAAASAPDPKQVADNMRKLKAVADDARKAQADLVKERQARESAEAVAAEARDALAKEQAAREKVEKEAQRALAASSVPVLHVQKAESDRKKLAEAEKKLEEMRRARNRDEVEKAALKREMEKVKRDLEDEASARAQFEQLASQAVSADDRVPRREVDQLRKALQISQEQCDAARRDTVACQQNAAREVALLKAWCERLQQQHRMQQQLLQSDEEFTPRTATPTPHSRTPRSVRKRIPQDLAADQRQAEEMAASDQRIRELEAHVARLQADLERSKDQERKAAAEAEQARKALKASTATSKPDSSKPSPGPSERGAAKQQEAKERAMLQRLDALERDCAEAQRKYDDLVVAHRQSEAARCEAELQVAAQRAQIEQRQREEPQSYTSALGNYETSRSEPMPATAGESTSALEERIKELERHLTEERVVRQAAERRAEELQKLCAAPGADAKSAAKQAEANVSSSGAGAKCKPQKAKSGCC
ncbi:protein of unknown function - conserved [Leishmania donovani]|uniref:Hypothetical_protein_conserved n=1 Tax=Leishmania donovani TaxID=5661 RepID=A0A6J8FJG5_LEIDO|nr:protein of unknown function - conserved [Leishmania donovani]VDZ47363.1 hypothetical_protein_conserved [Leishmania donovani]